MKRYKKRTNDDQLITIGDSCKVILLESDLPNPEAQLCAKDQKGPKKKKMKKMVGPWGASMGGL